MFFWYLLFSINYLTTSLTTLFILQLSVTVTDFGSHPLSSTASIHISIMDVNDNPPDIVTALNTTFTVSYQSVAGDTVGMITAVDVDSSDHGKLRFHLIEGIMFI